MFLEHRTFAPSPADVAEARRFVDAVIRRAGGDDDLLEWAKLVTSELVTNAVLHAGTPFVVEVEANGDVQISVTDRSGGEPAIPEQSRSSPGGRGLYLVAQTSTSWGIEREDGGKRVWCCRPRSV